MAYVNHPLVSFNFVVYTYVHGLFANIHAVPAAITVVCVLTYPEVRVYY